MLIFSMQLWLYIIGIMHKYFSQKLKIDHFMEIFLKNVEKWFQKAENIFISKSFLVLSGIFSRKYTK